MNTALLQALQITALGMGFVFGAIIVLWLMMALLTSLFADKRPASDSAPEAVALTRFDKLSAAPGPSPAGRAEEIAQAAAIAVAIALGEQENCQARALPTPPTAIVSAWQLGMRTRLLAEKGNTRRH